MSGGNFTRLLAFSAIAAAASLFAQPADRVLGVVTEVTPDKRLVALRNDAGDIYGAVAGDGAQVLRIAPGERDLSKAEKIDFAAIAVGDRLLVRGEVTAGTKTVVARTLIVMSKAAIVSRESKERDAWRTQSLAGVVKKIDAGARAVTMTARAAGAPGTTKEWAVTLKPEASLMRYSDDSVKYADAKPSAFEALREGDQLRVRGARDETASTIAAEALVFGSFRTVAGEIKSVNVEKREITITDLQTKKPLMIHVGEDAGVRKMPAFPGGGGGGPGPGGGGRGMMMRGGGPPGGGGGGMMPDFQRMIERMPPAGLKDLQQGDAVILSVAKGADASHVNAITLVAGVDFLLRASPAALGQMVAGWNLDMGMPQ